MKFTTAANILIATASTVSNVNAFAFHPTSAASKKSLGVVQNPTRGNVSSRKIKAWHNLVLEPWCGLKMSLQVDDELKQLLTEELDTMEINGKESHALAYEAKAKEARAEAWKYMMNFEGETGAAVIYSKLVEHGVEVVNGYSGGAVLPLLDQFSMEHPRHGEDDAPIRWITNSNENSAGHVAEGIAKSSKLNAEGKAAPGVVVATSGPGVTNLITPLQDAICDGVPMVVLCGQAATTAPEAAFQSAPAVDLTRPCTKWSYQITSAAELPFVLDYAFFVAQNGRPGPVFIDLPKDLQVQTVTEESVTSFIEENFELEHQRHPLLRLERLHCHEEDEPAVALNIGVHRSDSLPFHFEDDKLVPVPPTTSCKMKGIESFRADHLPSDFIYTDTHANEGGGFESDTMEKMMNTIMKARKPVLLAGQGCNDSAEELKKLSETLQIPVATTLHALGSFDERHPLALNMIGMHGHPTPNYMTQECDLLICVGSRFDDRITGNQGAFIPVARKASEEGKGGVIHVDIRLSEKAKQVEPDFFVHSRAKTFLQKANQYLDNLSEEKRASLTSTTKPWLTRMKLLQEEFPVGIPKFDTIEVPEGEDGATRMATPMSAQHVISTMNKLILENGMMDETLFSTGVGIHQMVAAQLITWTQPRQMMSSGSLGTMGVALGFCIGAKLANGQKMCIAIDGDGSFNMTFTELKTVAEQNIPIKILILDNESQMMVEYWQRLFCDKRFIAVTNEKNPEYTKLADAFGIKSLYSDSEENLEENMKEFLTADPDKPVLFHVKINRTPCLPLVAPGQALDNMILVDKTDQEVDKSAAPS